MSGVGRHIATALCVIAACSNNPYGEFAEGRSVYITLSDSPATLDPARTSDIESFTIASNIYATPYEFHYLRRPLELIPGMATALPEYGTITRNGSTHHTLRFSLRSEMRFDDDVCFADGEGREINIDDLIYTIKRAADSAITPFGKPYFMDRLVGFREFSKHLDEAQSATELRAAYARDIAGLRRLDNKAIQLSFYEKNPQAIYFFSQVTGAPVPQECVEYYDPRFHDDDSRITFDRHPVASGPFRLRDWQADNTLILERNPAYSQGDRYPADGLPGDEADGYLKNAGRELPMVDVVYVRVMKRMPPRLALFSQGYLDLYTNRTDLQERLMQTEDRQAEYRSLGVRSEREVEFVTFGWNFNLRDPVFANNAELRHAISLAIDREEMIRLFLPGRGTIAHGPIPPGLAGHGTDFNRYSRYDLEQARQLMREAGYAGGIDPVSGRPLQLTLTDRAAQGRAPIYRFYTDQLAQIGIQLVVEELDWPTLIERKTNRNFQMSHWGWGADYPDPQNFLQLMYGPNVANGYNETHYNNPEFNRLYERIATMTPGPQRKALLDRANALLVEDLPVLYLYHRQSQVLWHSWMSPVRPNPMHSNEYKYLDIDAKRRATLTEQWNEASIVAYLLGALFALIFGGAVVVSIRRGKAG